MNQKELQNSLTLAGKKLIAEFMGDMPATDKWYNECSKYYSSWDWLMPAWSKFNDLSKTGWFEHRDWCIKISLLILHEYTPGKAAKELSEAIQWYNTQK